MAPSAPLPPLASETLSAPARPELTGGRRIGVLLSHGLTGNPVSMNPWGSYLAEQGYAVEVPLLPGHGTTWEDANKDVVGPVVRHHHAYLRQAQRRGRHRRGRRACRWVVRSRSGWPPTGATRFPA